MKIGITYWSQTGNTETMAKAIAEGVGEKGVEVDCVEIDNFSGVDEYDKLILGCPSMGDEVLEEDDFEPFYASIEKDLAGKKVALFGSYDWGDGQWMRDWEERAKGNGIEIFEQGLIVNLEPDEDGIEACKKLGRDFCDF
ncbi:MAG: flavodoxin [Lachnospirales bacterium]